MYAQVYVHRAQVCGKFFFNVDSLDVVLEASLTETPHTHTHTHTHTRCVLTLRVPDKHTHTHTHTHMMVSVVIVSQCYHFNWGTTGSHCIWLCSYKRERGVKREGGGSFRKETVPGKVPGFLHTTHCFFSGKLFTGHVWQPWNGYWVHTFL